MHLLEKCHAYKDKRDKGIPADAGLFTYPVLMAADILAYDSDLVPVGLDQVQHIEVTRDIAQRFNVIYGETLHLPEAYVLDHSAKVVGTDGEKMSKSYGNTIEIFEEPKKLKKKINRIKTDSTPVEEPKNPDADSVFALYKLFASPEEQQALAARYRAGGMGYGEAKTALYDASMRYFAEARARREKLAADPDTLEDILQTGAAKARAKAQEVLDRARKAVGLRAC
jgi:tryptophanyl-tRNA synthetase